MCSAELTGDDPRGSEARRQANSLEFSEPGVGDDGSQDGSEVAEAAEGMVDGSGEVFIPLQVAEEVQRQHRCNQTTQALAETLQQVKK